MIFADNHDKIKKTALDSTEVLYGVLSEEKAKDLGVKAGDSVKMVYKNNTSLAYPLVFKFHIRAVFTKLPSIVGNLDPTYPTAHFAFINKETYLRQIETAVRMDKNLTAYHTKFEKVGAKNGIL